MFAKTPKTATAMALALGLAVPLPASAQDTGAADLPECTTMVTLPCVTATGAEVETQEELEIYIEAFPDEAAAAAERALQDTAEEVTEDAETEAAPDAGGDGAEAPASEPAPEGEAPAADAAAEPVPEGEAPAEDAAAAPAPEGDAPVADAAVEPAPEGEAPAEDAAVEPVPEGVAPAEDAVEAPPVPETPVTEEALDEAVAAPAPEATPDAAEAPDAPLAEGVVDPVEGGTVEADIPVVESETPPAAAAGEAGDSASAVVEEMLMTEETARSATEEFETAIGEAPPAAAPAEEDSGGLSDIQRALVAGLAGAAIGAITGQGGEVVANTGDRLVVRAPDGDLRVLRDENALLREPGARVRTETFDDDSTRTTVIREDGSEIVTIRAADGRVLRRTRVLPDGERIVLFDDTREVAPVDIATLPAPRTAATSYTGDEAALRAALAGTMAEDLGRSFSLRQVREIREVRQLAPEIEIDAITFATGSAAIRPEQARDLSALGRTLAAMIDENPGELFLVEGHTDAVGDATYNLALSDRRAETVALALTEFFDVPPENLVVQGYGESDLKIPTAGEEIANRRANVRRITPLIGAESATLR